MGLKINGSSSGSIELDVPAAIGSDVTGVLLPTAAGTLDRLERAGNILQVVQASTSTLVGNTTSTYADTGLSAAITPTSATNKILVIISQQIQLYRDNSAQGVGIQILRDTTVISNPVTNNTGGLADYVAVGGGTTVNKYIVYSQSILDSPSTTSSVTYKVQGRPYLTTDTGLANFQASGSVHNGSSYIQLIEVAA